MAIHRSGQHAAQQHSDALGDFVCATISATTSHMTTTCARSARRAFQYAGRAPRRTLSRAMISGRPMRRRSFARPTTAMNLSSCAGAFRRRSPRAANYQFPFRETSLSGWPMSGASVSLLRVYGRKIAEDQMEIHESRRGLALLCGLVATDARGRHRVHAPDNRTRA